MIPYEEERKEVLETARKMLHKGHVVGTSGNVSRRIKIDTGELYAITPSDMDYDEIEVEDIVIMNDAAKRVKEAEGKRNPPSVEKMLHLGIYKMRPDVGGIIHTHSLYPSAVSILVDELPNEELPAILEDQVSFLGGAIKIAQYAPSGTPDLAKFVHEAIGDKGCVIMRRHGACCVGKNLKKAYRNVELLNKTAQIYIYAASCGKVTPLPPEAIERARHIYAATRQM
ncbi:MAG TPA: class II aldolase/adducin family protein [Candidatus Deferrimicrobium sp.]|nr:class II aldolase/adducin family protein [Candidatus Deferrimicrobium sp.]